MVGYSSQGSNDFLIEYDNGNVVQDNDRYSRAVVSFIKGVASKYTCLWIRESFLFLYQN
jgi:hypothetical protein